MSAQDIEPEDRRTSRGERLVEGLLLALVVGVCGVVGLPQVVATLQDGSIELATVFYPVLLVAFAALAWTRRTGS